MNTKHPRRVIGATEAGAYVAGAGVAIGVQLGLRVDRAAAAELGAPVLAGRKR